MIKVKHTKQTGLLGAVLTLLGCVQSGGAHADEAPDLSGAELYQVFCASCHGKQAHGDGPVAKTLKPMVPDLTRISVRNGGVFPTRRVRETIDGQDLPRTHGTRAMPVWGWDFYAVDRPDPARRARANELINQLVSYIESIQRD